MNSPFFIAKENYLKSFGRLSTRLHFEHSAMFLSLPLSYIVFITISPPQSGQKNLCVATAEREFLLAPAMVFLHLSLIRIRHYDTDYDCVSQCVTVSISL